jgi:alkylation response protein AidB-like acyl-CoA dehydrogenase
MTGAEEPTHGRVIDEFRAFVADAVVDRAPTFEAERAIPRDLVLELAARRFLAAHIPTEYGGRDADMSTYGAMHAELGAVSSSARTLLTVHDMVAEVILRLGSSEQKRSWLNRLTSGDAIAAFALSEPGAGSDASAITTSAVPTPDGYRLTGSKAWISFGQLADAFLVAAKVNGAGPVAGFLVPRDLAGLEVIPIEGMLGLRASLLAEVHLRDCDVPREARVGPERLPAGLLVGTALHHGRFSVAWGCVGIGRACLNASVAYSDERTQFGTPISSHQLIRRMLTNMITDVRAAELLCDDAAKLWPQRDQHAIQATLVAKYYASAMASRVANDAVQIHGARGLSEEWPVARHFRDARVMEIIEGTNEIQQLLIAKYGLRTPPAARPDGSS